MYAAFEYWFIWWDLDDDDDDFDNRSSGRHTIPEYSESELQIYKAKT